ncbi:MAG: glycerol-3-phosphate dehydrogenase/oxidase [Bryobacteraceae bacterium]|nr:glycerol-3-phosphate dehydrogenase/oxidase [Bryobacteraceae bacterium]
MITRLRERKEPWDVVVIGGGATGVGVAVDAASRGYAVALIEQCDFGKGTSSRSTKLVHGGVRYLERGDIGLVVEALRERGLLRRNAPHLVHDRAFVVPTYDWWEGPFYGIGLKIYDLLAGKYGFGASRLLSREETLQRLPNLKQDGLRGGVVYFDGQFDDSRLLIHLARTAVDRGAVLANYVRAAALLAKGGVAAVDAESGGEWEIRSRVTVNATGAFSDAVRRMGDPQAAPLIAASQGAHLVFDASFLRSDTAILVPHTPDGRVLFAIPWHGHTLVGTTDTPIGQPELEARALEEEIDFILETAAGYLARPPRREDILSVFAGVRPLVKAGSAGNTAALSRDHTILVEGRLVTITGGKWTTYRHMAEDCVNRAAQVAGLAARGSVTREMRIHGHYEDASALGALAVYGSDAVCLQELLERWPDTLHPDLPYREAEVVWAVREEMARTLEDVLARRLRALFLNARAAIAMAPRVAELMAAELGRGDDWRAAEVERFLETARNYLPVN